MALTIDYPIFNIRRDAFAFTEEGRKQFDEFERLVKSVRNLHMELVDILTDRVTLPSYTNKAAADAKFTAKAGDLAYNTTDVEPMFHNGTTWKKFSDGSTAT